MTSRELLKAGADELARAGCPSPAVDAEWLLAHSLGISRSELYADGSTSPTPEAEARFRALVERRAQREPLAYVLGEWGFRRLMLTVDRRVLVPRPETEVVVERCLALLADVARPRVLDLGTGSGAIALAIADEHPGAIVVGTDSSADALAVASENRDRLGLTARVELVEGELFAGVAGPFDLIVSNPPYVDDSELAGLEPEVARYEPRAALVETGAMEAIAKQSLARLAPGAPLVLETADGKARAAAARLAELGYEEVSVGLDLAGRERVVDGRSPH